MNIKLFKAKLRRWIYRSERGSREARECNKCCLTCQKYFQCVNDSRMENLRQLVDMGLIPDLLFEFIAEDQGWK